MHNMRLFYYLILAILLCGCKPKGPYDTIEVVPDVAGELNFTGGSRAFTITASAEWVYSCDQKWVTISRPTTSTLLLKISVNPENKTRSAEVLLNAGNAQTSIIIKQTSDPKGIPFQSSDSLALVALYESTDGKNWYFAADLEPESIDKRWDFHQPMATWRGVYCSKIGGQQRVTMLDLVGRNAQGALPHEITRLDQMTDFVASDNKFSGKVIQTLSAIHLLRHINLNFNALEGEIPAEIGNLKELEILLLDANLFTGTLPAEFRNITSLKTLSLNSNMLKMAPDVLRYCTSLAYLDLSNNEMGGALPTYTAKLTKLQYLDLSGNNFTGTLPNDIGSLTMLETLKIGNNQLTGSLAESMGQLKNLTILNATGNKITDANVNFENCLRLQYIDLSYNEITNFNSSLAGLSKLEVVSLNNNKITNIGGDWSSLGSLREVYLSNNNLAALPVGIEKLGKLEMLLAHDNNISAMPNFGGATNLVTLNLSNNSIVATLPKWIGSLTKLYTFDVANNNFTGNIPPEVVVNKKLSVLNLASNQLSGTLAEVILGDWRFAGLWHEEQSQEPPYGMVDIWSPAIWHPGINICPQQQGYGFTNCIENDEGGGGY